jgi:alanine racemase
VVDPEAVGHNTRLLAGLAPDARFCAVVKADGYGHGAVAVSQAALAGGATWLAVAHAGEAVPLRAAGIDALILLLSEPTPSEIPVVVAHEVRTVVCTAPTIEALAGFASSSRPVPVHLKVDTGMGRIGCRPADALQLAACIDREPGLLLEGVMTHFALADEPGDPTTARQLDCFSEVLDRLERAGLRPPFAHAANSAGLLAHPASHLDLVRAGIAVYGLAPSPALAGRVDLRPALSLHARVSLVKRACAGQSVSYGHRHTLAADTVLATLPIGYADGVRRALGLAGAPVLIGARRRRMVGVVTMDQLIVDCGPGGDVAEGDEAVLIGRQGDEEVTAEEWAELTGTIAYEVLTGIGPRVPRLLSR